MQKSWTPKSTRCSGLSLVELLVVVAITAILATMAYPSMHGLLMSSQRDKVVRLLVSDVSLARSAAIKSTREVVVCQRNANSACSDENLADWQSGWVVFVDRNANRQRDHDEPLVVERLAQSGLASMKTTNRTRQLVFLPNGLMASGMTTFDIRTADGENRKVVLNRIGRWRLG